MSKNIEKTQPGWQIPTSVKESFDSFCVERGVVAQEDCAGALFLWPYVASYVREAAKLAAKGQPKVPQDFWEALRVSMEKGIQNLLDRLPPKSVEPPRKK